MKNKILAVGDGRLSIRKLIGEVETSSIIDAMPHNNTQCLTTHQANTPRELITALRNSLIDITTEDRR